MSVRLDMYASNDEYTVDGEAGIIAHIFERIGCVSRVAVEVGAGDGISCSNTARLWREEDWFAFLIEPDPDRFQALDGNAQPFKTVCHQGFITPSGPDSISELLESYSIPPVDFMSIDIDGDDYFIFEALSCRPRVVCIEFNPTVPPHVAIHQERLGEAFGASLLAMTRLGASLGYRFIGATRCNAFFILDPEGQAFEGYVTDLKTLFPYEGFTYAVTDFHGRVVLCGQGLPWQAKEPYVLPLVASTTVYPITTVSQHLRRGFESLWGPAAWVIYEGSHQRLEGLLTDSRQRLVCVDVTNSSDRQGTIEEIITLANAHGYRPVVMGVVVGLIGVS